MARAGLSALPRLSPSPSNSLEPGAPTTQRHDNKFGYVDVGVLFTVPLTGVSSQFGTWNLHGGANFLGFGDTTKVFNKGDGGQVIGSVGIGLSY